MNDLKREYSGERLRVVHCEGAIESFRDALTKVAPYKRKPTLVMHMVRQIETLANLGRLSGLHFPKEAELPNGSHFYALKRIPVRGYCWFSKKYPRTVYISHYVFKSRDKLSDQDRHRVIASWRNTEG